MILLTGRGKKAPPRFYFMEATYDKKRQCQLCDDPIPDKREDTICEECRAFRIAMKRTQREKVALTPQPIQFSERSC